MTVLALRDARVSAVPIASANTQSFEDMLATGYFHRSNVVIQGDPALQCVVEISQFGGLRVNIVGRPSEGRPKG